MQSKTHYKRILLKISGEILSEDQFFGIKPEATLKTAHFIKDIRSSGLEVGIVIGGGNIFRGIRLKELGMERTPADQMGMLGTLINGIGLQQALVSIGCPTKLMTALECPKVAESYHWAKALEYLSSGHVVIFAGGTGNPYFSTDTAAAMRACEIHADILLKATKVDGIYNKDPLKYDDAKKYTRVTYTQILTEKLEIMDFTAVSMCMSNKIPIGVFNMHLLGQMPIAKILNDENLGTLVSTD